MGLRSLVVSIAENQRSASMALAADGVVHYLGHGDEGNTDDLCMAVGQLVADSVRRGAVSRAGLDLVDGCGIKRVILSMQEETRGTRWV